MKRTINYFFAAFLFCACAENKNNAAVEKKGTFRDSLMGQWGSPSRGRPTLDIMEDSIYFFASEKQYPYKLIKNDIIVNENGINSKLGNVILYGMDTMSFESPPGYSMAAIRFKTNYPH